jgi:hypothetical protein
VVVQISKVREDFERVEEDGKVQLQEEQAPQGEERVLPLPEVEIRERMNRMRTVAAMRAQDSSRVLESML